MKVKDIIAALKENYSDDEELIVAWWERSHFNVSPEKWQALMANESKIDWSEAKNNIDDYLDDMEEEEEEEEEDENEKWYYRCSSSEDFWKKYFERCSLPTVIEVQPLWWEHRHLTPEEIEEKWNEGDYIGFNDLVVDAGDAYALAEYFWSSDAPEEMDELEGRWVLTKPEHLKIFTGEPLSFEERQKIHEEIHEYSYPDQEDCPLPRGMSALLFHWLKAFDTKCSPRFFNTQEDTWNSLKADCEACLLEMTKVEQEAFLQKFEKFKKWFLELEDGNYGDKDIG